MCGRIWIDLQDRSGRANKLQMVFRGVNRYRLDMPSNGAVTTSLSTSFYLPDARRLQS